jgi:ParB-like nuclease family protein
MSAPVKSEVNPTDNYSIFSRCQSNREINWGHVNRLCESIRAKNLLFLRPIEVTKNMEILDGQHRLEAAKLLKVPIYFKITDKMNIKDVALINAAQKAWSPPDYFNFYCSQGYEEYLKMKSFIANSGITFSCAYSLDVDLSSNGVFAFRNGEYICRLEDSGKHIEKAREIFEWCATIIGAKTFLKGGRALKALVIFLKHEDIEVEKFQRNFFYFVNKFVPFHSIKNYLEFFLTIYNYKNHNKIKLNDFIEDIYGPRSMNLENNADRSRKELVLHNH